MASAVSRDRQPFVLSVRSRTVANVLSIGFDVRTCFQCSAGKSYNASRAARSFARHAAGLSYLAPYFVTQRSKAASALSRLSAS